MLLNNKPNSFLNKNNNQDNAFSILNSQNQKNLIKSLEPKNPQQQYQTLLNYQKKEK